jgi:hypothetical protein
MPDFVDAWISPPDCIGAPLALTTVNRASVLYQPLGVNLRDHTPSGLFDPLGYTFPLPIEATCHPLGFPARVHSNSPEVLAAWEESWGRYEPAFTTPPVEIRVAVEGDGEVLPPSPAFRAHGHLLAIIADRDNFAVCDLENGLAFCRATRRTAAARVWLRYHLLEAAVFTLLTHRYVTAIHAACVAREGSAILLAGPPGAGKTTLAWACARAGWTYLSDDSTFLLRGAGPRDVIGKPYQARFMGDAAALFPELAAVPPTVDTSGQTRLEIVPETAGVRAAARAVVQSVIFLRRRPGAPPAIAPLDRAEAYHRLMDGMPAYERRVREEHESSVRRLLEAGCFEFHYDLLTHAVDALQGLAIPYVANEGIISA